MKIVFASTPGQETEISELVRYMYSHVFPNYFTDQEIHEFKQLRILQISNGQFEDYSTLKDAFQVMAALQTIISILELSITEEEYSSIFKKNTVTLQSYGLFFPFDLQQFIAAKNIKRQSMLSVYTKAANELLI